MKMLCTDCTRKCVVVMQGSDGAEPDTCLFGGIAGWRPATPVKSWYFTFGAGHENAQKYVVIKGTYLDARREMFERFGQKWSHQYASAEDAGVTRWGLEKLEE